MSALRTSVLVIALIGALAVLGPALDDAIPDHLAEADQAIDLQYAINEAIAQEKFAATAQALCGPQAAWQQTADGSVMCRTKYGKPTITVQVSP